MNDNFRLVLIGIIILTYFIALPAQAYACQCLDASSPQQEIVNSEAVFAGQVTDISPYVSIDGFTNGKAVTFAVSTIWKGPTVKKLTLYTGFGGVDCGSHLELGKEYIVYAYGHEGGLQTSVCRRTMLLQDAQDDLLVLGEGQTPQGGIYPLSAPEPRDLVSRALPLIAISSAALLLVGLLFLARRRRSAEQG